MFRSMRIVRFHSDGVVCVGQQVDADHALRIEGDLFGEHRVSRDLLHIDKLLAPLVPTDILCIGLNYREHAAESGSPIPQHPVLFIKGGNTLNDPRDPIHLPRLSSQVDYEGELAIVIGRTARYVSVRNALEYVFGYTCANDVSARDWQRQRDLGGGQWARGKSFDGFCPLGPCIVTTDEIPNPNALHLRTLVNDQVMQDHTTADMIFDVPALIASLSSTMTLRPGDVILTGTPQGVGFARTPPVFLKDGDTVAIEIEHVGRLENPVRREPGAQ
jgi:2-keto-4-pentenoate hydratase/2-oxohepta-3-ene-1,7-dioic acid hydratase in catechol pathway